jgi:hypothetical protein
VAKQKNSVGSKKITLSTTAAVHAYLEELVLGGLHGKNPAEAAERLLTLKLGELVDSGKLGRDPNVKSIGADPVRSEQE